jgi:hypothetical protein
MKKALFQPFNINKWFALGFTAFLAGLVDGHGGGGGGNRTGSKFNGDFDGSKIFEFPQIAYDWLLENPLWFTLIIFGICFLFALSIVLIWLSSRGKFMFLSNVIKDKAEISVPWKAYQKEGNSLFWWKLIYTYLVFLLVILYLVYAFIDLKELYYEKYSLSGEFMHIFTLILGFLLLIIVTSYISLFLNDFVVPIMIKKRIGVNAAWNNFLAIFSKHAAYFIIYGLFIFVLGILVVIAVILFGLFTCCLGFVLLIIPYISSVVLLPITYTYRAFSVEFLQQFGEEYQLFPLEDELTENKAQ